MINYNPFWKTLEKSENNWYMLVNKHGINPATLHRLKYNMPISTTTIDTLCSILNCSVADILEFTPNE
ncbi:MAG: helix-turn-helix transcriptional regulator [Lachnospiraceae bacterium]|nr:helix-turn-helix transcriptional regulator [Lachnospiraceae bacterium]